ncbi:hypothetical protein ACHHYP_17199 [Achlya hypogyna]|uniref:Uncharacterized protein n=1 Tax=Achlya hypogyna TaxID=1202772 RepID=A0A1V9ZDH6_ACHHY|nr:hypothetical protein ACHHYP_17199 [Achlya hypogyna]
MPALPQWQRVPKAVLACLILGAVWIMLADWNLAKNTATYETRLREVNKVITLKSNYTTGSFKPRNIRFLTLADDRRGEICALAAAVYQQGSVLEVMGWDGSDTFFDGTTCGERCKTPEDATFRFGQEKKLYWLLHYFENKPDLHDDDLVLFTDAWDVILNGDSASLKELFLRQTNHERGVIFNGEPSCGDSFTLPSAYGDKLRDHNWRVKLEKDQQPRLVNGRAMCSAIAAKTLSTTLIPGPNWSLGSGGILGDVRSIRAFLRKVHAVRREQEEAYAKDPEKSFLFEGDQILFQLAYLQSPEINAKVDASGEIFFVLSFLVADGDFDDFSPSDGCTSRYMAHGKASRFAWNQVAPVFFHFPGDFKKMYGSCSKPTSAYRKALGAGQYFVDVDRSRRVPVSDPTTLEWKEPVKEAEGTFKPRKIRFLTLADDPRGEVCQLAASIYQQGNVLEVMGWNYSDKFFDGTSCGARCHTPPGNTNFRFGQEKKIYWLLHYFENKPDLHDDDLVLFTDAWDVIVNGDSTTLTSLFLKQTNHNRGVIFNGEPTCGDSFVIWGPYGDKLRNRNWRIQFEKGQTDRGISGNDMCSAIAAKTLSTTLVPGPNWSLGSGGILGDVRSIRAFLRRVHEIREAQEAEYHRSPHSSFLFEGDQILFQLAYLRYPEINAKVDASAEIFFVLSYYITAGDFNEFTPGAGCTPNYMSNGTPSRFAWNQVAPVFFHFPGGYKYMYRSCANPTAAYRQGLGAGQYFVDVDRGVQVPIKSELTAAVAPPTLLSELDLDDAAFVVRKVHIVTLADNPTRKEICPLAASVYSQGHVLDVLGWNYSDTFFDNTTCGPACQANRGNDNRYGQQKKLHWLLHYFERHPNLHDDDLVLFTDAWDVIVNGDTRSLTDLFFQQTGGRRGVIFNGEPSCGDSFGMGGAYGDKLRSKHWPIRLDARQEVRSVSGRDMCYAIAAKTMSSTPTAGPNWSLGSGGILGDVRSARAFLQRVDEVRREQEAEYARAPHASFLFEGDQILFQLVYLRFPEINALVDTAASVFFVLSYNVGDRDFAHFTLASGCTPAYLAGNIGSPLATTGAIPVFFHFPGSSKRHLPQCFAAVERARATTAPRQYFVDVDRNTTVLIRDLCPTYS